MTTTFTTESIKVQIESGRLSIPKTLARLDSVLDAATDINTLLASGLLTDAEKSALKTRLQEVVDAYDAITPQRDALVAELTGISDLV